MPLILGVDPGSVSAAYAFIHDGKLVACDDVPVIDKQVDAVAWHGIVSFLQPDIAVIEQVSAWPGQGVSSSFKFGQGVGLLRGVLASNKVPLVQVSASKWKNALGLNNDPEKSRALALRLYPAADLHRKKDHNRAEAILLAHWHMSNPNLKGS